MLPTLQDGDMLLLKGVEDKNEIKIGEIIVFYNPGSNQPERIIHRVFDIKIIDDKPHFITKGDNNPYPDRKPVPQENVIGVVVEKIPTFLSYYIFFIDNLVIKISMLGLLVVVFLISSFDFKNPKPFIKGKSNQK